jgi:formylglycine-generating enzyme required for sulfatase activity
MKRSTILILLFALTTLTFAAERITISPENVNDDWVEIEMVFVKGGTFKMGCAGKDCLTCEKPAHSVTLSDFYIGKYEVTQKQWAWVMGSDHIDKWLSRFKGDNLPVSRISWDDAQEFIAKLNSKTGKKYRLPTEAEWEYAARGGAKSKGYKYSGSNDIGEVAWYNVNSGDAVLRVGIEDEYMYNLDFQGYDRLMQSNRNRIWAVGLKKPNELGIYDMSGNVCEWVNDWFDGKPYDSTAQINPKGPKSGTVRGVRGGYYRYEELYCRVFHRSYEVPDDRLGGIRLVLSP